MNSGYTLYYSVFVKSFNASGYSLLLLKLMTCLMFEVLCIRNTDDLISNVMCKSFHQCFKYNAAGCCNKILDFGDLKYRSQNRHA